VGPADGKATLGPRTRSVLFPAGEPRVKLSPDGRLLNCGVLTVGETATGRTLWQAPEPPGPHQGLVVRERDTGRL
jgi:hypothetical protein